MHVKSTDCNVYSNRPNNRLWWLTHMNEILFEPPNAHDSTACSIKIEHDVAVRKENFAGSNTLFTRLIFSMYIWSVQRRRVNKFAQFNRSEHKHVPKMCDAFFLFCFCWFWLTPKQWYVWHYNQTTTPLACIHCIDIKDLLCLHAPIWRTRITLRRYLLRFTHAFTHHYVRM